ncbi:MAG: helix-turn-helix domain-containing protein [Bacteroidota bacterium]
MPTSDIILIIVSGLGVIHGLFLSIFLWVYTKGSALSNKLLSLLLLVLSFRIGKSVFLEFADNIDIKLIFTGLGTIMAIGPLFYFFTKSCVNKSWKFSYSNWIHLLPSSLGVCFGLWLEESDLEVIPKWIFATLFLTYYTHFIVYLIVSFRYTLKRSALLSEDVFKLLRLLFYALLAIWVVYVLNLFDEIVPYIFGPVLYSIVAYVVSFQVIRKGYMEKIDQAKYKTTPASDEQLDTIFRKVSEIILDKEEFKNPDVSLNTLSKTLNVSPQMISMTINQKSKKNFNSYINTYRIQEASRLLQDETHGHLTIAAIAFEVGFNSISSFNTAFKKQMGKTPQAYRKQFTK